MSAAGRNRVTHSILFAAALMVGCGDDSADLSGADAGVVTPDASETEDGSMPTDSDSGTPDEQPVVRVGVPREGMESQVDLLEDGGEIFVRSAGQGGTHAEVGFECEGLGSKVTYLVNIRGLDGEGEVETLPLPRPRPIICDAETGVCRVSPIIVLMGGLSKPGERTGIEVEVTVTVTSEDEVSAVGRARGVLVEDLESIGYLLDSGVPDGSTADASVPDAGITDAGELEASTVDE